MKIRYIANFLILILLGSLLSCGALSESRRDATTVGQTEAYEPEEESMERSKRAMDRDEPAPTTTTAEKPKPTNRMVIYESSLSNSVNELEPAIQRTKAIVEKFGGYIEKQQVDQQNTVASFTLRVPVTKFAEAMDELSQIGKVTSRTINARDITREFSDLSQRLQNRKQLLARLYEILKKTTETKQKIRILNEIARLNKEVESMEARASFLAKKAAFSTISITFRAEAKAAVNQGSAIGWIRNLRPQSRSLSERPKFDFAIPEGFLDYRESYAEGNSDFIYASPDGVKLRAATIENNPRADASFFKKALLYERDRYPEKVISSETRGNRVELTTPQQVGYKKAFYTVVLFVDGDDLHIIEVFYPNEETFKKRQASVEKVIGDIQPQSWWVALIPFI